MCSDVHSITLMIRSIYRFQGILFENKTKSLEHPTKLLTHIKNTVSKKLLYKEIVYNNLFYFYLFSWQNN